MTAMVRAKTRHTSSTCSSEQAVWIRQFRHAYIWYALERRDDGLVEDILETPLRQGRALQRSATSPSPPRTSTYLTAPSSRANRSPASVVTGRCFCRASFSTTAGSSRRSICVPTIKHGTPGQWWWTCARELESSGRGADLGEPLLADVLERGWARDAEADEEDVRLGIRQRPKAIVVLLACRVEQAERVRVLADHDRDRIVVEDGGDVCARQRAGPNCSGTCIRPETVSSVSSVVLGLDWVAHLVSRVAAHVSKGH